MKRIFGPLLSTLRDTQMHLGILTEAAFVLLLASGGLLVCFALSLG
jgi:hypothetical protein